jgi:hypothetical protein
MGHLLEQVMSIRNSGSSVYGELLVLAAPPDRGQARGQVTGVLDATYTTTSATLTITGC